MKAVELQNSFGIENLALVERPEPQIGPREVLVAMKAVSLNYRDLLLVRGHYNPKQPLPIIPCSDGAGEVIAVGEKVTRVKPGDLVTPVFCQSWISGPPTAPKIRSTLGSPLDGTLCQKMALDEQGVVRAPDHLSAEQAATLPCAALTAWNALTGWDQIKAGATVLIQGTGGVALFALQFAKLMGARVDRKSVV